MKNLLIASMILASSVTANAGNLAYTPPQAAALEEPAMMGGSGAWLIPLVIIAVVGLALAQKDDCRIKAEELSGAALVKEC